MTNLKTGMILLSLLVVTSTIAIAPTASAHECANVQPNSCGSCIDGQEHYHEWSVAGVKLGYCKTVKTEVVLL